MRQSKRRGWKEIEWKSCQENRKGLTKAPFHKGNYKSILGGRIFRPHLYKRVGLPTEESKVILKIRPPRLVFHSPKPLASTTFCGLLAEPVGAWKIGPGGPIVSISFRHVLLVRQSACLLYYQAPSSGGLHYETRPYLQVYPSLHEYHTLLTVPVAGRVGRSPLVNGIGVSETRQAPCVSCGHGLCLFCDV